MSNRRMMMFSMGSSAPLFLDLYPNAKGAYSFRKLRKLHSNSLCINVERSSDNTTTDIGFVSNYIDTAALLSFVGVGTGYIRKFYDQSGNGITLEQTGLAVYCPKIVISGTLQTESGKVCATQDVFGSRMICNIGLTQPSTHIVVIKVNSATGNNHYVDSGGFVNSLRQLIGNSGGNDVIFANNSLVSNGAFSTTRKIHYVLFSGASSAYTKNATTVTGNAGTATAPVLQVGAGSVDDTAFGNWQEAIFYDSDESSDRTAMMDNINDYYNVY